MDGSMSRKKTGFWLLPVLVLALLAAALLLFSRPGDRVTVHLMTLEGEEQLSAVRGGALRLPQKQAPEGYCFLGWQDSEGRPLTNEYTPIEDECWFTARYGVDLQRESHKAYLFADENGFFRPDEAMTRGDAARMFAVLLAAPVETEEQFSDVKSGDLWSEGAAALKELGIVTGKRFRPRAELTLGELLDMLSGFYPPAAPVRFENVLPGDKLYGACCLAAREGWIKSGAGVSVPVDEPLARRDAALIMNRVLGRSEKPRVSSRLVGSPADLNPRDKDYWSLVEACISHEFTGSGKDERWTASTPVKPLTPGPFLLDFRLYYVNPDGLLLRNDNVGNLHFGPDGRYTSGSDELDALVQKVLRRVWKEGMSREEFLRALYLDTRDSYSYLRREPFAFGDTSWLVDEAILLLTTGRGNCYSYASTFCELARAIGYDAVIYSGTFGANEAPHAWVEIDGEDGEPRIYDVEIEMAHRREGRDEDFYAIDYQQAEIWTYVREHIYSPYYY